MSQKRLPVASIITQRTYVETILFTKRRISIFSDIPMYLKQFLEIEGIYYPHLYKGKPFPKKLSVSPRAEAGQRQGKTQTATPASQELSVHHNCAFSDGNLWQRLSG